ncbi:hypothetical protein EDB86DRAFT_2933348 [Lactarius hatsudake]|nr:hypothetical protein EDB86DRAFT_2933348 [Lactarius hatsudake]
MRASMSHWLAGLVLRLPVCPFNIVPLKRPSTPLLTRDIPKIYCHAPHQSFGLLSFTRLPRHGQSHHRPGQA